jgi:hypothetical protein
MRSKITIGAMILAIAALHQLVGIAAGLGWIAPSAGVAPRAPLVAIASDGVVDAVEPHFDRAAIVWFLLFGVALALVGLVVREAEFEGRSPSRTFAICVAAMCAIGVVLMPVSGFWLGLIPAFFAWRRARPVRSFDAAAPQA